MQQNHPSLFLSRFRSKSLKNLSQGDIISPSSHPIICIGAIMKNKYTTITLFPEDGAAFIPYRGRGQANLRFLNPFLNSTSLAIKIIKAWDIQASSFGISFSGLTLRPYLRLGFLFKVLPSDHIYQSRGFPFDTYIVQK